MPDADGTAPRPADAHAALKQAEAELRRLHAQFAWLAELVHGEVETQLKARDDLIAEQAQRIRALNLSLARERGRRLLPKSARGGPPRQRLDA